MTDWLTDFTSMMAQLSVVPRHPRDQRRRLPPCRPWERTSLPWAWPRVAERLSGGDVHPLGLHV